MNVKYVNKSLSSMFILNIIVGVFNIVELNWTFRLHRAVLLQAECRGRKNEYSDIKFMAICPRPLQITHGHRILNYIVFLQVESCFWSIDSDSLRLIV